jgi:hypothetical protein
LTKAIVVTGCDAAHYELATDLFTSLRDVHGAEVTIGFIHVGDDVVPPAITALVDHIVHVPVASIPGRQRDGYILASLGVKPHVPEFFPGFDIYVWLDGDTWVQNAAGVEQLIHCAQFADICLHPEADPNYFDRRIPDGHSARVYMSLYGRSETEKNLPYTMLNAGVFAARAQSPVWGRWKQALADVAERWAHGEQPFFSDQIPLHRLIASGQVSVYPLRAVNNWLVYHSTPSVNLERKRLLAPTFPHEEINIIHLVASAKNATFRLGDSGREITFRYRDIKALFGD